MAITDFLPAEEQKVAAERARHDKLAELHITRTFQDIAGKKHTEKRIAEAIATDKPYVVTLTADRQINSPADLWKSITEVFTIPRATGITPDQVLRNSAFIAFKDDIEKQGFRISEVQTKKVLHGRAGYFTDAFINIEPVQVNSL